MLQKNLRFIGNLLIVSVLSVIIVNISSLPVYIYLITANWFTLLVSFSLYAVIIVFLYNIYKTTAELRQFDFRPWRTRLNKRALLLMVIGAVIIVALAFGYAKLTAVWHITESGRNSLVPLAYYTLFGMVLGTIYLLSKHDIRVNSVTHMLANLGILWLVPS
ncbi:CPBP family intramembrane glutamate endopeptidase [Lactiplantibacillus plantarum]|uniref:CPBP family intramembrane glutamate endopeptidase n=1 Tax=Lactiplantibacillus plantarum TaxID=1590 RepID=UPI003EBE66D1